MPWHFLTVLPQFAPLTTEIPLSRQQVLSKPLRGSADLPAPLGVPPFHKKKVSHATQLRHLTELKQLWALCAPVLLGPRLPTSGRAHSTFDLLKTTPGHYNPNFRDNKPINILKNNVEEGRKYRVQYFLMLSYHHSVVLHRNEISYSLLAAGQGVGLDGIYCTREYTHMSRAPSSTLKGASPAFSTIFPAMTECQRGTLNFYKLWEAGAWDVMENRLLWICIRNQNRK